MNAPIPKISGSRAVPSEWSDADMECYLDRCQVDTPDDLVARLWLEIAKRRPEVGSVVDFGAGDGRFSNHGSFQSYRGYEIDAHRIAAANLPANAELVHACAFSQPVEPADVVIGNPPFVRNQDLPEGWRSKVSDRLFERTGVRLSGLANAWQYFFLLSLATVKREGLCALIIPFEWVSRPSSEAIRQFISSQGWNVDVHRLEDATFGGVLTTASITIIDTSGKLGRWRFFAAEAGKWLEMPSASGGPKGHVAYRRGRADDGAPRAMRGLSPGSQKIFVLTEGERARLGLRPGRDVVKCVTSLRCLSNGVEDLTHELFDRCFRLGGRRCWLLNVAEPLSPRLDAYLGSISEADRSSSTCTSRPVWWRYQVPEPPQALVATCFKGQRPKAIINSARAIAVGGVAAISGDPEGVRQALKILTSMDLSDKIVSHANGLFKVEINQLNSLMREP